MASASSAPLIGQAEISKPLPAGPRFRLSVMMFLELFIWGAWLPLIFGYLPSLGFTPLQQSWILNCFALASFVGMFFSNQFADRNFSAEKFLAVSHLIGGVAGARPYYMIDYWGLSMTQASRQLRALLAQRGEKPPGGKNWTVAVCGPHPAVVVGLGDGYDAIWDPQGADLAMMLNEFYCADLDAPVVLEVVREGVVYARVYDIRSRSYSTLLRYPTANKQ